MSLAKFPGTLHKIISIICFACEEYNTLSHIYLGVEGWHRSKDWTGDSILGSTPLQNP